MWAEESALRVEVNVDYVNALTIGLNELERDKRQREREANYLCGVCFYMKECTTVPDQGTVCLLCKHTLSSPGVFCESCAHKHDGCVSCGSLMKEKLTNSPKDEWITRLMKDRTYINQIRTSCLRDQIRLFHKDVSHQHRRKKKACKTCYYVDEYHKTTGKLSAHYGCLNCHLSVTGLKHVPRTLCETCAVALESCVHCGQILD